MKKLILSALMTLVSTQVFAQVVFAPGIGYYDKSVEATEPAATERTSKETRADLKLGYVLPMGLYLGGMYSMIDGEDCTSASNCNEVNGFLVGPSIGYHSLTGFYAIFTYNILGESDLGNNNKLTGAQGPQVDLGWIFPLTSYFGIGPQITYRSIEYDKLETTALTQDTDTKETSIAPYVSLWFMF